MSRECALNPGPKPLLFSQQEPMGNEGSEEEKGEGKLSWGKKEKWETVGGAL